MTTAAALDPLAREAGLRVAGLLAPEPEDGLAAGTGTVVLLAPAEPAFWQILRASAEWRDGAADPIDRWSQRVVAGIAEELGGRAVFPFGAAPYWPFHAWALRSGQVFESPVGLLMDAEAGLFVSFRGAVLLAERLAPRPVAPPCESCAGQPCRTACPVGALSEKGYDVPSCHEFLDRRDGIACLSLGCQVRRACPVGAGRRPPEQSAYHMRRFHEVPCDA